MDKNNELEKYLEEAIWICRSLFNRGKATGTSANISFLYNGYIYISGSGTCFGNIRQEEFAAVKLTEVEKYIDCIASYPSVSGLKPSKELPLHYYLYQKSTEIQAVIHTHSFYCTLISCIEHKNERDIIPTYTPYLGMKVGKIGLVPYAKPGSSELFAYMKDCVNFSDGFILANHGPLIPGKSLMDAFAGIEELEESARIAWHLKDLKSKNILEN